jgi:alpha-ketoglutarate-dependent taurine dioxygenase
MSDESSAVAARPDGCDLRLDPGRTPVLRVPGPDLPLADVRTLLARHGALLVRGLGLTEPADLAETARALGVGPMVEREGFTGRGALGGGVYTNSPWPADEAMCMHHESSYAAEVPAVAMFACLTASGDGGVTGVADARTVLARLPGDVRERFEREGWRLTRHYRPEGPDWTEAFGSRDAHDVDAYCRDHAIEHAWLPDGTLRTVQRRAAVVRHPVTGERLWFNQVAFLNAHTMDPVIREYLVDLYGPHGLPFDTAYGDGAPIPASVIETVNDVYTAATLREPWQSGDLLVLDNLRTAHSREPYAGERRVVALFGDAVRLDGHLVAAGGAG